MKKRLLPIAFLVVTASMFAQAPPPLSDYTGTYAYGPGRTVELVANGELYALLDDAKYRLPAVRVDVFKNGGGQEIRFHRDAKGHVTGFEEAGVSHARISDSVKPESLALMRP